MPVIATGTAPGGHRRSGWHAVVRPLTLLLGAFAACACGSRPAIPVSQLTPADWAEDIDFVVETLTEKHPDLFGYHGVDPSVFDARLAELRERARTGPAEEVVLGLDALVALVGDGHTSLDAVQSVAGLPRLPVGATYFGEELRIFAVARGHEEALGARIVAVGSTPVEDALRAVSRLVSHDNAQEFRYFGPTYMVTPAALRFVGVTERTDSVVLTLRRDGEDFELAVPAWSRERLSSAAWLQARDTAGPTPLYLSRRDEPYWLEHLADERAVYVHWDRVNDADEGPSLGRFYDELFDVVDRHGVDRLIVDLRENNGGNFHRAERFVEEVLERPRLSRPGGLFVLTAPRTFSAATHVAARLRFEANGLIVGEASRGNPNYGYNAETVALPRSGLHMEYTDELHDRPPFPELGDSRRLPVDIPAHNTFADYLAGRDAVLEAALRYGG